jgi:serine/threonine-protein kinase
METPLPISPSAFGDPRYSPDGSQIAYDDGDGIRIYSFATGATPLFASGTAYNPVWSASGEYVYFTMGGQGAGDVYRRRADLSEEAVLMSDRPDQQVVATVSADDSIVVVREANSPTTGDLLLMRQGASGVEFEDFLTTEWREQFPSLSPDGRWIAYESDQSGEFRVYVQSFPIATGQYPVSPEEGFVPLWHPDGRTLYYHNFSGQYMAVDVTTEPTFSLSSVPRVLFESPQYLDWDIHPEGSRFVVVKDQSPLNQSQVVEGNNNEGTEVYIVTNWFTELRELFGN